jgi:GABA(A) receptor-associated protein
MDGDFKKKNTIEKRKNESDYIRQKHPTKVPIIVEALDKHAPKLPKSKYLANSHMTMGQFVYIIRKHMELNANQAIFIMIQKNLVPSTKDIGVIYEEHKDDDGFLYVNYSLENTFG